jgi:hypothetical protein
MDYDESHLTSNEKMQPIKWTERPTSALVGANSLYPELKTICRRLLELAFLFFRIVDQGYTSLKACCFPPYIETTSSN